MSNKNSKYIFPLVLIAIILGITIWIISEDVSNIRSFLDQNIWARWVVIYIFSVGFGILFSIVVRRLINKFNKRLDVPLLTIGWIVSILGFIMCFIISGSQMDYLDNYYSWNTLIGAIISVSVALIIFSTFAISIKYVFK